MVGTPDLIATLWFSKTKMVKSYKVCSSSIKVIAYRSRHKKGMDSIIMFLWLQENRVFSAPPHDCQTDHAAALENETNDVSSKVRFFRKTRRTLFSSVTSSLCKKLSLLGRRGGNPIWWRRLQMDMWADASVKLRNPQKAFTLELSAKSIHEVNHLR